MKTIGMIGGMSWESTQHYYKIMNEYIREKLGGHNSIEAIIYSVNFASLLEFVERDDWSSIVKTITSLSKKLQSAGADFLIMTANAIHKIADDVEANIEIPFLHIVDPTADAIKKEGLKKVGLLGTKVTMEEDFYKERLKSKHDVDVLIPEKDDREKIHRVIFEELTIGKISKDSKREFQKIILNFSKLGAQGVVLGCTEISLLIHQNDVPIKLFDTTDLHAKAAVEEAIS